MLQDGRKVEVRFAGMRITSNLSGPVGSRRNLGTWPSPSMQTESTACISTMRSTQMGNDPEVIYMLGALNGEMIELRTSDLIELVRNRLGPDTVVSIPRRQLRERRPPINYNEALRRVRESPDENLTG